MQGFHVRKMNQSDKPMIIDSWRGCVKDSPQFRWLPEKIANVGLTSILSAVLARSECLIMTLDDDDDFIASWAVAESAVRCFHFVYTKAVYRKNGFAAEITHKLMRDIPIERFSFWEKYIDTGTWEYCPELMWHESDCKKARMLVETRVK